MNSIKIAKCAFGFLGLLLTQGAAAAGFSWNDEARWAGAVRSNLEFFDRNAWDEPSGSYASDLDRQGRETSGNRYPVALARMVYANAQAPGQNLRRARKAADFLVRKMMARDMHGVFFKSSVDASGREIPSGRSYVFGFEQSYPIAGLAALYAADPVSNSDLLPVIRVAAKSYWKRFHDPVHGGLFYYYNFSKQDHSNDQGETHKSYQSTVYPISSFLFELREIDPANRALYDSWTRELLESAAKHIVEYAGGRPTGWLRERLSADFVVDESYKKSEAGHITQLAWVFGLAVQRGVVTDSAKARIYLKLAKSLLANLLAHGGISPTGAVYDAFDRTTGKPMTDSNGKATSAWWSTLEAVIAYAFARQQGWMKGDSVLNRLTEAYFNHFVDSKDGGEFFRIDSRTGEVVDGTKGGPGKSGYHITETYRLLFGPGGFAR